MPAKNEAAFYTNILSELYPDSKVQYNAASLEKGISPASLDTFLYAVHIQTDVQVCCAVSRAHLVAAREEVERRQREGLFLPIDETLRLLQAFAMTPNRDDDDEDGVINTFVMSLTTFAPFMERLAVAPQKPSHWMLCAYTFADQTLLGTITQLPEAGRALLNLDAITAWSRRLSASDLGDGPNDVRQRSHPHGGVLVFESVKRRW